MLFTDEQLSGYEREGVLFVPEYFSREEVNVLRSELPASFAEDSPRRVMEQDGRAVRSVYGGHTTNEVFRRLARLPRLVGPARRILGSEVYVYQFKVNAKAALSGDLWQWHQDYIFWQREDGLPAPRAVNVAIFLDEVTEFNGPLLFAPGSHSGVIDVTAIEERAGGYERPQSYAASPAWITSLTAGLKYALEREVAAGLVRRHGIVAPKGPAGSAVFFHPNILHASANNISPYDRVLVIVTYNSVENLPVREGAARPDFLASRDARPVVPIADDALLDAGAAAAPLN